MENPFKLLETKFMKLLDQFLIPNHTIDNTYLELLISQLNGKYDAEEAEKLLQLPFLTSWIEKAVNTWEKNSNKPSKAVQTFILNLCSLLSNHEFQFIKLELLNIHERLCTVLNVGSNQSSPSVKLGYVKLLSSCLKHDTGRRWIFKAERWKDVINFCYEGSTIYVTKEGYKFVSTLFTESIDSFENECLLAFAYILLPIQNSPLENTNHSIHEIQDEHLQESLIPMLQLLGNLFETCYQFDNEQSRNKIFLTILKTETLEQYLTDLIKMTCDDNFHNQIIHPLILLFFAEIEVKSKDELINHGLEILCKFFQKLFDVLGILISKENTVGVLNTAHFGHLYWQTFTTRRSYLNVPEMFRDFLFENQMIIFQIMPIINAYKHKDFDRDDELMERYTMKLFKIAVQRTTREAYAFRNMLLEQTDKHRYEIAKIGINSIMKVIHNFHRDRAIILFQSLMFMLKDITDALTQGTIDSSVLSQDHGVLATTLEAVSVLIQQFDISWRESIESICLMYFAVEFFTSDHLSVRLVILCLKLIKLTTERFMQPNLALLVDRTQDSSIPKITPILYKRLHDMNWEIRDSTLETLHAVVLVSECKFPAFQELVLKENLCSLVATVAMADSEGYVRATALKCLSDMIKVETYWNQSLINQNLPEKVIQLFRKETEGLVRQEAAKLLGDLYENQKINHHLMNEVYEIMKFAAIQDLHWEVKVNALMFWKKVIHHELSEQGMIDGAFPSVTFSKEKHKIVSLTPCEIINRLQKVLLILSNVGCLSVLVTALHDNCDITVVETAAETIKYLTNILNNYNILSDVPNDLCQQTKSVWDTNTLPKSLDLHSNFTNSTEVINSIVEANDMSLLADIYKQQFITKNNQINQIDTDNGEQMVVENQLKTVSPETFLSYIKSLDIDKMVYERCKWLRDCSNDLGSLLDDIMKSYNDCDINSLDCY